MSKVIDDIIKGVEIKESTPQPDKTEDSKLDMLMLDKIVSMEADSVLESAMISTLRETVLESDESSEIKVKQMMALEDISFTDDQKDNFIAEVINPIIMASGINYVIESDKEPEFVSSEVYEASLILALAKEGDVEALAEIREAYEGYFETEEDIDDELQESEEVQEDVEEELDLDDLVETNLAYVCELHNIADMSYVHMMLDNALNIVERKDVEALCVDLNEVKDEYKGSIYDTERSSSIKKVDSSAASPKPKTSSRPSAEVMKQRADSIAKIKKAEEIKQSTTARATKMSRQPGMHSSKEVIGPKEAPLTRLKKGTKEWWRQVREKGGAALTKAKEWKARQSAQLAGQGKKAYLKDKLMTKVNQGKALAARGAAKVSKMSTTGKVGLAAAGIAAAAAVGAAIWRKTRDPNKVISKLSAAKSKCTDDVCRTKYNHQIAKWRTKVKQS